VFANGDAKMGSVLTEPGNGGHGAHPDDGHGEEGGNGGDAGKHISELATGPILVNPGDWLNFDLSFDTNPGLPPRHGGIEPILPPLIYDIDIRALALLEIAGEIYHCYGAYGGHGAEAGDLWHLDPDYCQAEENCECGPGYDGFDGGEGGDASQGGKIRFQASTIDVQGAGPYMPPSMDVNGGVGGDGGEAGFGEILMSPPGVGGNGGNMGTHGDGGSIIIHAHNPSPHVPGILRISTSLYFYASGGGDGFAGAGGTGGNAELNLPGAVGGIGQDGSDGGRGGTVKVLVSNPDQEGIISDESWESWQLTAHLIGGNGAEGGKGGDGGFGGSVDNGGPPCDPPHCGCACAEGGDGADAGDGGRGGRGGYISFIVSDVNGQLPSDVQINVSGGDGGRGGDCGEGGNGGAYDHDCCGSSGSCDGGTWNSEGFGGEGGSPGGWYLPSGFPTDHINDEGQDNDPGGCNPPK